MDKDFLLIMLQLKQAINNNDSEKVDNAIAELNKLDLNDEDTIAYMKDYFINLKGDIKLIKHIIDNLSNLKDKEALSLYVELTNTFIEITPARIKQILKQNVEFENRKSTISLYGLIAQAVVFLDDPDCLKMAIDKLQNL